MTIPTELLAVVLAAVLTTSVGLQAWMLLEIISLKIGFSRMTNAHHTRALHRLSRDKKQIEK